MAMDPAPSPRSPSPLPGPDAPPSVVLDTNVVLDWLVFRDPSCDGLATQLQHRRLLWFATPPMRAELASVVTRPQLLAWEINSARVLSTFDELALVDAHEANVGASGAPRCRDPDDQKFIDRACAIGARWLFTRDRALLDLANSVRIRGIEILRPVDWQRQYADAHAIQMTTRPWL